MTDRKSRGATTPTTPSVTNSGAWSESATRVLRERYLWKNDTGAIIETPDQMCWRVARAIASAEATNSKKSPKEIEAIAADYAEMMLSRRFMPNSPTLMNAGKGNNLQLSACFVLPVEDSLAGIFESVKQAAIVHQSGGGTGFSFSRLRPEGSHVASTHGVASGPVSFMRIFDQATDAVKQGGCVVPETRISLANGMVQIGTLGPTDADAQSWHRLPSTLTVATDNGSQKAEDFYFNGSAAVRRLRTKNGYHFTGTLEHRIRIIDQSGAYVWKHLQDVQIGDWVALQKNTYPDSTDYRFTKSERIPHFNAKAITSLEQPTSELGEFVGYFIGDGSINYYNAGQSTGRLILTVADSEPEVGERLLQIAQDTFGITPNPQKKPNDASINYFFASTELVAWLKHIGVTKTSTLDVRVPEVVFAAGAEFARGFLRGLFTADGSISAEGYPSLYSISRGLVEDVQQLLLALGIPSSISVITDRESAFGKNPIYKLRVITQEGMREFAEQVAFMSLSKNARLDEGLEKAWEFNDVIPNQSGLIAELYDGPGRGSGTGRSPRGANRELYRDIQHYLPGVAAPRHLTRSRLQKLAEKHEEVRNSPLAAFLTNNQFYDQVASIEEDEAVTVDLSVTETHTYVANGFVSHNSRRGANMGILRVDHPDIEQFIDCKLSGGITNFNISVAITDVFMDALLHNTDYELIDPHTNKVVGMKSARVLMDRIISAAWSSGDPGLVFLDRANRSPANPTPELELLEATNPCGEQFLGPFDACNLGSINLGLFVENGIIDWESLGKTVHSCVRFLDDVIDINPYPLQQIHDKVHANRRIGLGVMGWADMLFKLGTRYDSAEAVALGERVMRFVSDEADMASTVLAEDRGVFPSWQHSIYKDGLRLRNSNRTTVAPTGTISIIADCSSGIEPIFALAFQHRVKQPDGTYRVLDFVNPIFIDILRASDIENQDEVIAFAREHGSLHGHPAQSHPALAAFVTAHEIAPEWHIQMQAAFQKGVNSSISKTINLPNDATLADVEQAYLQAWNLGCLGITVFRDGCKGEQVLNVGVKKEAQPVPATVEAPGVVAPAAVSVAPTIAVAPAVTVAPAPIVAAPARSSYYTNGVKARPDVVHGYTRQVRAPEGKVSVTLNSDDDGLLEVFVTIGKAGSDVSALAEALGRLISRHLRIESPISQNERARDIADQLHSIGGSTSIGFGMDRVRSLPDAVARAISMHLEEKERKAEGGTNAASVDEHVSTPTQSNGGGAPLASFGEVQHYAVIGNLCPQCGCNTLVYAEGCKKCMACGHSEC